MSATWFIDHDVTVFPLKNEPPDQRKEPACKWMDYTCTRALAERFRNYGVRLGTLLVVDADTAINAIWVAEHIPATPFYVKTGRGAHAYYRNPAGKRPAFLHRDGLTIETKNHGMYVVGPGSVHPSGTIYTAADWSWNWDDIPEFPADFNFDDGSCGKRSKDGDPFELPEFVEGGERHDILNRMILSFVGSSWADQFDGSVDKLRAEMLQISKNYCRNICRPPLVWNRTLASFFARSFDGAWKIRQTDQKLQAAFGERFPLSVDLTKRGWI